MPIPETPLTRQEQYWAAILDKIQGGGGESALELVKTTQRYKVGDVFSVGDEEALRSATQSANYFALATCVLSDTSYICPVYVTAITPSNHNYNILGSKGVAQSGMNRWSFNMQYRDSTHVIGSLSGVKYGSNVQIESISFSIYKQNL